MPAASRQRLLEGLGFDPDALWVRDAGLLFDPHFLGALHAELEDELGPEEARTTLLQIGFLQGLREAQRVLDGSSGARPAQALAGRCAPVPIQLRVARGVEARGGIALEGIWPERSEASARLASLGVASTSACAVSAGFTSGWLSGMLDEDVLAVETSCAATGAAACCFAARDAESWRIGAEPGARAGLDVLPFAALRELVRERTAGPEPAEERPGLETSAGVVHIWGPVMVVPWGGADEALAAIELVGRDPGAREVSVIVVDLTGASVDEGFAAVALERIVETVEDRGSELLIAGASPEAEQVLADLERPPLASHKDLDHAVAAAFQIAEAQRRLL